MNKKESDKFALAAVCYALPRRKREGIPGSSKPQNLLKYLWPFPYPEFRPTEKKYGIDHDGRKLDLRAAKVFIDMALANLSEAPTQAPEPVEEKPEDVVRTMEERPEDTERWVDSREFLETATFTPFNPTAQPHLSGVIYGKTWGVTQRIFCIPGVVDVWYMRIKPRSWCSKHYHERKHNCFYLLNNELTIETWKDYGLVDRTLLEQDGQSTTCKPGEWHRFKNDSDEYTEAIEIYWGDNIQEYDIIREDHGGSENEKTEVIESPWGKPEVIQSIEPVDHIDLAFTNLVTSEQPKGDKSLWKTIKQFFCLS